MDEKGVVNYSNSPPPGAGKAQAVEDRVSSYETDPELKRQIERRRNGAMEAPPERPRGAAVIGRYAYGGCTPPHFPDCPVRTTYGSGDYPATAVYRPVYRPAVRRVVIFDDPPRASRQRNASLSFRR